jgi:tetratricopeptide (TPR) repeat protein
MGILNNLKQKMGLNKEPIVYAHPFGESFNKECENDLKTLSSLSDEFSIKESSYFVGKGLTETMLGHYDQAIDIFNEGHLKYPNNLELVFLLNRTLGDRVCACNRMDLVEDTIDLWDKFIEAHPNEKYSDSDYGTADAYVERGLLKQTIGKTDEAQEDYKKALQIDPKIKLPQ